MTIPFLGLFKKKAKTPPAPTPAPPPLEKSSSERLSKTVMPSATKTISPASAPVAVAHTPAPQRSVSFNGGGAAAPAARPADFPPALALALEPRVERAVSLELGEVIAHIPEGFLRELEPGEAQRPVLLRASELERGMANGRPTVAVSSIYEQVPDIFIRPVVPGDPTQLQLPFHKVLEQFTKLQVRADQSREQMVPQVETPFLRVTLEDDTKFGTSIGPIQTTPAPPIRLEPATARTISAAEPEPIAKEICTPAARTPVSFKVDGEANGSTNGHAAPPAPAPSRIPFKLSPKGTDASAENRVPASGGPSVPMSLPDEAPAPAAPSRIPFKLKPAAASAEETPLAKGEPWLTKDSFDPDAVPQDAEPETTVAVPINFAPKATVITLPLKAIMQMLTPFQVIGDANKVPEDARIDIPFALVEPQLATGRVQIKPDQFAAALPKEFAGMFDAKSTDAPVSLPLHEVLKNLPTASLRMRDDQVEQEKGANFETPFSAKAEEDALRFKVAPTPVPKPAVVLPPEVAPAAVEPTVEEAEVKPPLMLASLPGQTNGASKNGSNGHTPVVLPPPAAEEAIEEETPAPAATNRTLNVVPETDESSGELSAKDSVAQIVALSGVKGCAIMFGDGLSLAGDLPEEYDADGLCAMAPSLMQRIENHMLETNLGELRALTMSCSKASITFFMHENLCLAVLHDQAELAADIRERVARIVHELSKKYSHPA